MIFSNKRGNAIKMSAGTKRKMGNAIAIDTASLADSSVYTTEIRVPDKHSWKKNNGYGKY
jgi:hypothetical protein